MQYLKYKDRPLIKRGNEIIYGDLEGPYMIKMTIKDWAVINKSKRSKKILIELVNNQGAGKVIKRAERESIYKAVDLSAYWLKEALASVRS